MVCVKQIDKAVLLDNVAKQAKLNQPSRPENSARHPPIILLSLRLMRSGFCVPEMAVLV